MLRWLYIPIVTSNIYSYDKIQLFSILPILQTNLFQIDLPKNEMTYRGQVVNPWPQAPQGQPVTYVYVDK